MAKKQKLTPNQMAFKKEINRIRNFVRRAEKRGYMFPDNIVPQMPKRVTAKALTKVKEIKPESLYGKSRAVIAETGEIISGSEARKIERQAAARKAAETRKRKKEAKRKKPLPNIADIIIMNFKSYIAGFPKPIAERLLAWVNELIRLQGKNDVAIMLEESAHRLGDYLSRMGYDSKGAVDEYTSAMINYLPNVSETFKRDLQELFENEELGYLDTDYEDA